jgi:flagellar operon protein
MESNHRQVRLKLINKIQNCYKINEDKLNHKINRTLEFNKVLENIEAKKDLKLSAHAVDRLKERNIDLTERDITTLKSAVDRIRDKGGKEALIIYNNVAYITSVRNNTIITAVDSNSLKENVFTNIDSAVIL